jgi:SAM-dependent methyltransferase
VGRIDDVSAAWERNSEQWAAWARTPGHDVYHSLLNFPAFAELIPAPGRQTLDVGCGEGRVGRWLAERGHRVVGIDSSPTLARLAEAAGGYLEIVCHDARILPWTDDTFDLAVAYMSLHDMPSPAAVIGEIARVLEPQGLLCIAIVHPVNRPAEHLDDYFREQRFSDVIARDGLSMSFEGIDRPLEAYTEALASAGFVIERLREPRPAPETVERAPRLAPAAARPYFLQLRCRLEASGVRSK